ncbi:hypothetical protein A8H37_04360 [Burkholderia thailandensis]|nr:hypothetical protein A8H37_04360 [Burkholderia thailandensis]
MIVRTRRRADGSSPCFPAAARCGARRATRIPASRGLRCLSPHIRSAPAARARRSGPRIPARTP